MADFQKNPPYERERVLTLHEGAINRTIDYLIGENQAAHIENLIVNRIGERTRRGGARAFGGHYFETGGIGSYNESDFDEVLVGIWGKHPYKSTGNGGWNLVACGTSGAIQADILHDMVRTRQTAKLALGITSVEQTTEPSETIIYNIADDASTKVSVGARAIASFQERLWLAAEENLYWSEIGEPADFSLAGNFIGVEPGIGGFLTAIVPSRDNTPKMWLFKEEAILLFEPRWGSSSAILPTVGDELDVIQSSVRVLTQGAGCLSTRSAIWVPGQESADVFFLSGDGVRSLLRAENDAQAGAGFPLSFNISDWIDRINFASAHKASAAVFDNAYHLAVPLDGATYNTHILRFDILHNAWSLLDYQARDLRVYKLGSAPKLYFQNNFRAGDTSVTSADASVTGPFQVYRAYTGNVDPSESHIVIREDSRSFMMGEPTVKKRWDELILMLSSADTSTYKVQVAIDRGPFVDLVIDTLPGSDEAIVLGEDALPWYYDEDVVRKRSYSLHETTQSNIPIPPGYFLQVRITGDTTATDVGALKIHLEEVRAQRLETAFAQEN